MLVQMVAVGEESGNLPEMLSRIAGFYEEVATMSQGLASVLRAAIDHRCGLYCCIYSNFSVPANV